MHRTLSFLLAGGLALGLSVAALAKPERFADLAPRQSAFIVDVPNFASTHKALERSGLLNLWKDPALRDWLASVAEEPMSDLAEMLERFDLKLDDLKAPAGVAGAAFWHEPKSDSRGANLMVAADFGANAKDMTETFNTVIERGERDKKFTVGHERIGSTDVHVLTFNSDSDDDWSDSADTPPMYCAWSGTYFVLTSTMESLENALQAISGKDIDSLADSPDLAATLDQHPKNSNAYAALMVKDLIKLAPQSQAGIFTALGLDDVRAVSMGLNFEPTNGVAEQTFGILMNRKRGLFSLIDGEPLAFKPPAFVNADAATFNILQFKFAQLLPTIKKALNEANSEDLSFITENLSMIEPMAAPILNSLGSKIYIAQSYSRPFAADSQRQFFAIELTDRTTLANSLSSYAPMIGLTSRDFQGNQIWGMEGAPIALGTTQQFLMIGHPQSIEDAMRQADAKNSLAQDARFTKAASSLSSTGISFGWSDTRQMLRYVEWAAKNHEKIVREQISAMFGDDPEFDEWREEMVKDAVENQPAWQKNLPSIDALLRYFGDTVYELKSTSDGFRGKSVWLKPAN